MDILLQLKSTGLSDEVLDQLTRQLAQTIDRETDITTTLPTRDANSGAKGDPVTIGALILSFISSGAAVSLFEVFKTYFGRNSNLTIELKRPDGIQVSINAQNMKTEQIQNTVEQIRHLLGDK